MPKRSNPPSQPDWQQFEGFDGPHYTPTPDTLFDWVMAYLTGAELKVLLYIVRRTFGFKRDTDTISIEQMEHGLRSDLETGTLLARTTILEALRSLKEKNLIVAIPQYGDDGTSRPSLYRLHLREGTLERTPPNALTSPQGTLERTPTVHSSAPTRKSTPRNSDPRNSHDPDEGGMAPQTIWEAVVQTVSLSVAPDVACRLQRLQALASSTPTALRIAVPTRIDEGRLKGSLQRKIEEAMREYGVDSIEYVLIG